MDGFAVTTYLTNLKKPFVWRICKEEEKQTSFFFALTSWFCLVFCKAISNQCVFYSSAPGQHKKNTAVAQRTLYCGREINSSNNWVQCIQTDRIKSYPFDVTMRNMDRMKCRLSVDVSHTIEGKKKRWLHCQINECFFVDSTLPLFAERRCFFCSAFNWI